MKNDIDIRKELQSMDFSYSGGVNYDAESIQADDHYERCAGDYCRCSRIEATINSIDHKEISNLICERFSITDDRIASQIRKVCSKLTVYDFEVRVCGGYYGEETDGVVFDNYSIFTEFENIIDVKKARKKKLEMLKLSIEEEERIKKILISEYGYLLDSLKESRFSIIEISPKDIIFPSKSHADNVGKKYLYSYRKHQICGIVKERDGKYLVIDGYHRITANLKSEKIKVILSN